MNCLHMLGMPSRRLFPSCGFFEACVGSGKRGALPPHRTVTSPHAPLRTGHVSFQTDGSSPKSEACGTTHAVIPSFSLPGTSIGTKETEKYLINRARGVGRGTAGKILLQVGLPEKYQINIDKMFQIRVDQAKAHFPQEGDPTLNGMEWVTSVVSDPERPLCSRA